MRLLPLSIFSLPTLASATTLLLPLYIWPGPGTAVNWDPVYSALASYPTVSFTIIVNPWDGPGAGSTPDSDYAPAVAKLNSYPNAKVIGYVHTLYTAEPLSAVEANVTTWANWNTYAASSGVNTTVQGIFFDEAPNDADSAHESYMSSAAEFARNALKSASNPVPLTVYNPGATAPTAYFTNDVDLIVQFESPLSSYKPSTSSGTIAKFAAGTIPKSAVIAYSAGTQGATVTADTKSAKGQGIGGIYFDADDQYADLSLLGDVAAGLV